MKLSYFLLLLSAFALLSCDDDEAEFDRNEFLSFYADEFIQPSFADLANQTASLKSGVETFLNTPNLANLQSIQNQWTTAYGSWMKVNSFNFGPGGTEGFRRTILEEIGLWPANVVDIEEKIATNNLDVDDGKRDTRSLLAVEYLIFRDRDNEATLATFDQARLDYLNTIIETINTVVSTANNEWQTNYAGAFVANNGTEVTSSTTLMFNEFVRSFESLRDLKVATPMGLIAGLQEAQPDAVEALYSRQSVDFLRLHWKALTDLWEGRKSDGTLGVGWRAYIASVDGGDELIASTEAQIAKVNQQLDALPANTTLYELAQNDDPTAMQLERELQFLTRYFKSDISSLLGLAITFSTIDGD